MTRPSLDGAGIRAALASVVLAALSIAGVACGGGGTSWPRIVYEAKDGDATNVFTIDPKSGDTTQLTHNDGFDGNPAWSPDRGQIIFTSDRASEPGIEDVWLMDAGGANPRRLTRTPDVSEWSPKYAPGGKQVAYVQVTKDEGSFLALMEADGSNQRRIAGPFKFAEFPAWMRDGSAVYFAAITLSSDDIDIYSADIETREVKLRISTPAGETCPHFTHDGKKLSYASVAPGAGDNEDLFRRDVSETDTSNERDERLTDDPATDDYGNPSPDDRAYVFIAHRDGNAELYLMDADGKHQRRLTNTPERRENVPDW